MQTASPSGKLKGYSRVLCELFGVSRTMWESHYILSLPMSLSHPDLFSANSLQVTGRGLTCQLKPTRDDATNALIHGFILSIRSVQVAVL